MKENDSEEIKRLARSIDGLKSDVSRSSAKSEQTSGEINALMRIVIETNKEQADTNKEIAKTNVTVAEAVAGMSIVMQTVETFQKLEVDNKDQIEIIKTDHQELKDKIKDDQHVAAMEWNSIIQHSENISGAVVELKKIAWVFIKGFATVIGILLAAVANEYFKSTAAESKLQAVQVK